MKDYMRAVVSPSRVRKVPGERKTGLKARDVETIRLVRDGHGVAPVGELSDKTELVIAIWRVTERYEGASWSPQNVQLGTLDRGKRL